MTALRILQPHAAMIMFSGYCGVPCHQLQLADVCIQKGETRGALLPMCGRLCVRAVTDFAVRLLREMTRGFPEVQVCRDGQNVWR